MKKLYTPVGIVGVMCVATGLLPWIVLLQVAHPALRRQTAG
ncbi:MAG TPA: hypothetical protein VNS10_07335 [Gemmatimonadaceae bacterium]|jgi:hypothetical protein|nr:hypothetical protein [Gemmatimonadaceae bacterium]